MWLFVFKFIEDQGRYIMKLSAKIIESLLIARKVESLRQIKPLGKIKINPAELKYMPNQLKSDTAELSHTTVNHGEEILRAFGLKNTSAIGIGFKNVGLRRRSR